MSDAATPPPTTPPPTTPPRSPARERLSVSAVRRRIADFAHIQYMQQHAVLKGVTLGAAAMTLPRLLGEPPVRLDSLALWMASGLTLLMNHVATSRGTLLVTARFNVLDVLMPFALAGVECTIFLLAVPEAPDASDLGYWYFVYGFHGLFVAILLSNRIHLTRVSDFAPALAPLATQYVSWVKKDRIGAAALGVTTFFLGFLYQRLYPAPEASSSVFHALAGAAIGLVMLWVFLTVRRQRAVIVARVEELSARSSAAHAAAKALAASDAGTPSAAPRIRPRSLYPRGTGPRT